MELIRTPEEKWANKAGRVLADCTLKAEEQTQLSHRAERGQHSWNGFTGGIQSLHKKVQNLLTQEVPSCPKQSQKRSPEWEQSIVEHSRTCKSKPTNVQNHTHICQEFSLDSTSWWCCFPNIRTEVSLLSYYSLSPFILFLGPLRQCLFLLLTHLIYLFNLMEVSIFRSILQ